jgi:plasmid maintenance system antidote protein VapI
MEKLANVQSSEILNYEFLEPLEITTYRLSKDLRIPPNTHFGDHKRKS